MNMVTWPFLPFTVNVTPDLFLSVLTHNAPMSMYIFSSLFLYFSHVSSWENLFNNKDFPPLVIISFIRLTCCKEKLDGDRYWGFMG